MVYSLEWLIWPAFIKREDQTKYPLEWLRWYSHLMTQTTLSFSDSDDTPT